MAKGNAKVRKRKSHDSHASEFNVNIPHVGHVELAMKYALLVTSINELLARHNKLIFEHKELNSSYKELKNLNFDHNPSNISSSNDTNSSVAKVDASISYNDLLDMACSSYCFGLIDVILLNPLQ